MKKSTACLLIAALTLRLLLYTTFPNLPQALDNRVECSTPISSFKRVKEGIFQHSHGASPYHGGTFHQSPLILALLELVDGNEFATNFLYSIVDVITGYLLSKTARLYPQSHDESTVAAVYLFNPFTLLSTLSRSTNLFTNAAISLALSAAATSPAQSMNALALASCLSFYPVYLAPALIYYTQPKCIIKCGLYFVVSTGFYLGLSFVIAGGSSWDFISGHYGMILMLKDLTPTIGVWWYFFTEMFEFFRPFFVGVFQIYCGIYSLPLAIRFKHCPLFALATMQGIITMFKSYPEVGDIGFYFALLALYKPIFGILRYPLPSTLAILYVSVLAPTFYHLWIYAGSGNSNFFYAITLVYELGMTLVVADSVWSAIRYEYDGGKNPNLSQI